MNEECVLCLSRYRETYGGLDEPICLMCEKIACAKQEHGVLTISLFELRPERSSLPGFLIPGAPHA